MPADVSGLDSSINIKMHIQADNIRQEQANRLFGLQQLQVAQDTQKCYRIECGSAVRGIGELA